MEKKMHSKKIVVVGICAAVALALGIGWISLPACALEGNSFAAVGLYGADRFSAIKNAVEMRNYDAWKQLMAGRAIARSVTFQNFDEYAQAWFASVSGNQAPMNAFKQKYQVYTICPLSGLRVPVK